LEQYDLTERYGLDVFTDALPEGEARTVAESYVRFARGVEALSDERLFDTYPQFADALDADDPTIDQTACRLIDLLKRHAACVLGVTAAMVSHYSHDLARGALPENCLIRLMAGGTAALAAASEVANTFRREGDLWTIVFRGQTTRLRDAKGLRYIARLLAHPEQQFGATDLASGRGGPPARTPGGRADRTGLADERLRPSSHSVRDEIVDHRTLSELRARLQTLRAERAEAEACQDVERAWQTEQETAQIETYLGRATRLGGGARAFTDETERARNTVSKAIGRSLKTIEAYHPALGRHLRQSLTIGSSCSYTPDSPIEWDL
jgi:hypothetical protein